jgi:hypothetical protein
LGEFFNGFGGGDGGEKEKRDNESGDVIAQENPPG